MQIPQALYSPLPEWARPTNPVLRHMLQRGGRRQPRLLRVLLRAGGAVVVAALVAVSYAFFQDGNPLALDQAPDWDVLTVLYFPLWALQIVALAVALLITSSAMADERRRGTWESYKITSHGAEMVMRARWAATFYQMRWLLAALVIPRVIFVGAMLVDLTDYQGYHLDLYLTGITPDVPVEAGVLLLAALMTAGLLQVLVLVGLNAALGLVISAYIERRGAALLARLTVLVVEGTLIALTFSGGKRVLDSAIGSSALEQLSMADRWGRLLGLGTLGDMGLRFMDLRTFLQTWTDVDYGVLLGVAILAAVAVQVVVTNGLLLLAVRRATRPTRE